MPKHLVFLVLVLVLTGCTEVDMALYDNDDYDGGINYHAEQWGQRRTVRGPDLQPGQSVVILQNDGVATRAPTVKTLLLNCVPTSQPSGNFIPRWSITVGGGGAQVNFLIDAIRLQQISVPANKFTVSLLAEAYDDSDDYDVPNVDYVASAFVGLGNTSNTEATYTTSREIGTVDTATVLIPAGATALRILGTGTETNNFTFGFNMPSDVIEYTGDQLQELVFNGGYMPIPGGCQYVTITTGAAAGAKACLQWQLDL